MRISCNCFYATYINAIHITIPAQYLINVSFDFKPEDFVLYSLDGDGKMNALCYKVAEDERIIGAMLKERVYVRKDGSFIITPSVISESRKLTAWFTAMKKEIAKLPQVYYDEKSICISFHT